MDFQDFSIEEINKMAAGGKGKSFADVLKHITEYDGEFSKQEHLRYLKWLEKQASEKLGIRIVLTEEEVAQDTRGFRLSHGA